MQIKQNKFNVAQSGRIQVLGKGSDVKTDMQLTFNTKQLNIGASITGKVVDSNNTAIQGAIVKLMDNTLQPLANAMTDANGNYSISSIPSSTIYNMVAIAQGKIISQTVQTTVAIGQSAAVNFTLQADPNAALGTLSGTVMDVNSSIVSGAVVLVYSVINGANTLVALTYTDTSGIFTFSDLSAGSYSITVTALGYIQGQINATVQNGAITTVSNVLSINPQAPNGIVSGVITDSTATPVASADVVLYSINSNNTLVPVAYTKTNSAGIYTFINVSAGNYLVKSNQSQLVTV